MKNTIGARKVNRRNTGKQVTSVRTSIASEVMGDFVNEKRKIKKQKQKNKKSFVAPQIERAFFQAHAVTPADAISSRIVV